MNVIKVLVVDDSAFMRKMLSDIINSDPDLEVVGTARNGQDALKSIRTLNPDVATLDVEMPEMDGMMALETVMRTNPMPIIMLSSLTQAGADKTMRALELGAVDFIAKPSGQISLDIDKLKDEIIRKIKMAAGTKKTLEKINRIPSFKLPSSQPIEEKALDNNKQLNKLIVIGTSTGGPKALNQVLPKFPASLDAAILVVQHMPAGFTRSLAERLNSLSRIKVKEAEDGETILPGCAYIAPGDYHLKVQNQRIGSTQKLMVKLGHEAPRGGHRPSVDEMFVSVAEQFWGHIVAVIMTGMGNDGTVGLQYVKAKGAKIIAEHQSSCVVYGMPKSAIESGHVTKVAPVDEITNEVLRLL